MNQRSEIASPVPHSALTVSVASWDLVLAASRPEPTESDLRRLRSLLCRTADQEAIEWGAVLRLAEEHGTSLLLHQNLQQLGDTVPASVRESLRRGFERNVHKSLFLARELIRILDCLGAMDIEAIPYKGVVLSEAYYGDMALRQAGDIDLFVRKKDVARIRSAVRELGYTERVPILPEAEADYMASGYECSFDSSAGRGVLELQWALQPRFYAVDFDMDGLVERAVEVTVAERSVKTPCAEDLVLVLSVHAAKHVWGRLLWLCDIARILKRENLDWDGVKSRAQGFGIQRILHVTLLLANRLLGTKIPLPMEGAVLADHAAYGFSEEVATNLARGVSYDVETIAYFRLMMRLRERRADRWRFLARLTFTPGPGEWEVVRLPRVLFPLYRVVRLVRLAARFAGG